MSDGLTELTGSQPSDREIGRLQEEAAHLREQLLLRDQAFNAVSTHFMILRHDKGLNYIEYCNRTLAGQYGFSPDELIGKPLGTLMPDVVERPEFYKVQQAVLAGEVVRFEDRLQRSDGSRFWAGITITPVRRNDRGEVTHTLYMGADITIRREAARREKQLQEQLMTEMKERELILLELKTAQKLEAVGRLAAGVAHEINTPIQYVSDSLHFLQSACGDFTKLLSDVEAAMLAQPDVRVGELRLQMVAMMERIDIGFLCQEIPKAFERTFEGADRVASIVRAMKEFSHPDATEFSPADINHALQNTLVMATNEYKYVAKIHTEFDPDLPQVMCNIGELNQVFLNLIVNATHAIQDAGKGIEQGEISIATARAGDYVEITIADSGCGIPQENLDKIYDPFFTTKEVGRGTGQGLAITRSVIVDKHGGSIQAYSEVGKGTQFIITLLIEGRARQPVGEAAA